MTAMIMLFGLTLFLAIALLALSIQKKSSAEARLYETVRRESALDEVAPTSTSSLLRGFSTLVNWVRNAVGLHDTSKVERQLALAGYRKPEQVEIYYAVRLILPVTAAILTSFFIRQNTIFWFFACTALAYFGPDLWLTSAINRRRDAIRLALPDALDLLVICMEAGLGMDQALLRVGSELSLSHPELSDELRLVNLEQRAGTPRVEAWKHMSDRTKLETVRAFVSMLVQTDRFGTPVSKSLGAFSDALRIQRRQKAEELAAKTTVKMVFPLVLFIFPSIFIVLLGPAIISIQHSMSKLFE